MCIGSSIVPLIDPGAYITGVSPLAAVIIGVIIGVTITVIVPVMPVIIRMIMVMIPIVIMTSKRTP